MPKTSSKPVTWAARSSACSSAPRSPRTGPSSLVKREKNSAVELAVVWRLVAPNTDCRHARELVRAGSRTPPGISNHGLAYSCSGQSGRAYSRSATRSSESSGTPRHLVEELPRSRPCGGPQDPVDRWP
ncbi:hypothetical protein ABZY05_42720 [Streptomyces canus]|uniref:hypothetical protein n=1 Tax=Streptomyces canus TaxID=58343 RepID=UPI0033B83030